MRAKLIHKNSRQRFYELSEPIKMCKIDWFGECDIVSETRASIKMFREELKEQALSQIKDDGIRLVCVSDAHSHIERLVFPAIVINGEYSITANDIAGKHTMMIDGGDPDSVYDDAVYLRRLCQINNLKWEGCTRTKPSDKG